MVVKKSKAQVGYLGLAQRAKFFNIRWVKKFQELELNFF